MRCAACNRPLLHPAFTAGKASLGRVCAEKAGLIVRKKRVQIHDRPTVIRDKYTRDWVKELAA